MTRSQKEAIGKATTQQRALGNPVADAVRAALEDLLATFSVTPSGPLQTQPATRQLFKLTPDPTGLTISIIGQPVLPVTVEVSWNVLRDNGSTQQLLSEGNGFDATPNLNTDPFQTEILFFPQLAEDVTGAAATARFRVRVSVKLSATVPVINQTVSVGPVNLPDVPVTIPVLLVPSMLVFFRHKNFQAAEGRKPGFALVTVPVNSALGNSVTLPVL